MGKRTPEEIWWKKTENFNKRVKPNIISLSCHEQVCLLVHDMINLLYYEYWTDKQKYLYVELNLIYDDDNLEG